MQAAFTAAQFQHGLDVLTLVDTRVGFQVDCQLRIFREGAIAHFLQNFLLLIFSLTTRMGDYPCEILYVSPQ